MQVRSVQNLFIWPNFGIIVPIVKAVGINASEMFHVSVGTTHFSNDECVKILTK